MWLAIFTYRSVLFLDALVFCISINSCNNPMTTPKLFIAVFVVLLPAISFSEEAEPKLYFWNNDTSYFDLIDFSAEKREERIPLGFNTNEKTVLIIHGFSGYIHTDDYRTFARRIKKIEPKTNVLALDWLDKQNIAWIPGTDPVTAASQIPEVARWTYYKLVDSSNGLGISVQKLHIIGFSHGAHVAALIGKRSDGYIAHLTFLDPSTRKTHLFTRENFLGTGWTAQESGKFVDMYKTSQLAATGSCRGHVSFRVQEKDVVLKENSIKDVCTNHNYAFYWYLSTIGKTYKDFGYSITVPDKQPAENKQWTGTIFSSLPKTPPAKGYDDKDYNNAIDSWEKTIPADKAKKPSADKVSIFRFFL